jgi:hypothetical protein
MRCSSSHPKPSFRIVVGLKFSTTTSEILIRSVRIFLPFSCFKSSARLFLLRLRLMK